MDRHNLIKFRDHRYCDSGHIMILICYVTSRNHVFKELCVFIGRSPSR